MSSSIFFRFKSSKEATRIQFDGTSISVWDAKREIINNARLGDGTDFDLTIYNADSNEEYDDDTVLIPRSTTVIARRLPASNKGQGKAARYVSGRMPVNARAPRQEPGAPAPSASRNNVSEAQTEEEKIAAMFQAGSDQWEQQKQSMASATPVFRQNNNKAKANVPDHPPPSSYTCHRCGQPGHWIQACPTNGDPNYENQRHHKATGIPKMFLKTVEKPQAPVNDGLTDDTKQRSVMVNEKGEYVIAMTDDKSFAKIQARTKASAAKQEENTAELKELEEKGLLCPIDKRLFVDPMKTPCCGKTYCSDCIENALAENDLTCPGCFTDGVLIDNLVVDDEANVKIKAYEEEKRAARANAAAAEKERSASPKAEEATGNGDGDGSKSTDGSKSPPDAKSPSAAVENAKGKSVSPRPESSAGPASASSNKKRKADEELQNTHVPSGPAIPTGPKAMRDQQQMQNQMMTPNGFDPNFVATMNKMAGNSLPPFPMMPMNPMMNPMMMMMGMNGGMSSFGQGMQNGMNGNFSGMPMQAGFGGNNNMNSNMMGGGRGGFQGGNNFQNGRGGGAGGWRQFNHGAQMNGDDDAYMRKPVNPHRHQGKKKARPAEYRQL